ncbi:hypothetical protein [Psychromonas sp. Urea-02u-13]|uniref:hypothetical protein n=1 Tax=Psychromonas sp. Urea-02u-13 TaxID=2058326 RepID=UPI0012FF547C|nr:hypothetical protein [Psychromonas sp. Urea-02u-13]
MPVIQSAHIVTIISKIESFNYVTIRLSALLIGKHSNIGEQLSTKHHKDPLTHQDGAVI